MPHPTPHVAPAALSQPVREFDLRKLPPDFYENPYPTYHVLRAEAPVLRLPDGGVFLTRHADLVSVYRDAQTFTSDKRVEFGPKYGEDSPLFEHHTTSLVFNDPPQHTRVRRLIMGALTQRVVRGMESGLTALVDRLLDGIARKGGGDLIEDFASAIPVEIIGNLLNVPLEDRGPLRAWSLAILGALEPAISPQQLGLGQRSVTEFKTYLTDLVAERRRHPGDPSQDLLTRLIQGEEGASDGETIEPLSETELLQNCIFILNAGHETTTNLIGNALVALTEWPGERQKLIDRPGLMEAAVEEFLRFESSNQLGNRRAAVDTQIAGHAIPAGTPITLCIGAANRDPAVFSSPDTLDLERYTHDTTGRHLAFGFGIHQCAGLSLARLEGRIAIGRFLQRFGAYRLSETPQRGGRARFRGFLSAAFAV
jgi:cytochrome P450